MVPIYLFIFFILFFLMKVDFLIKRGRTLSCSSLISPRHTFSISSNLYFIDVASLDSTAQTGQANAGGDWQEEIYQKVLSQHFISLQWSLPYSWDLKESSFNLQHCKRSTISKCWFYYSFLWQSFTTKQPILTWFVFILTMQKYFLITLGTL